MTISPTGVPAAGAASAYSRVQGVSDFGTVFDATGATDAAASDGTSFGSTLQRALDGVVQSGQVADQKAAQGISGEGNVTDVVMAVSQAQLALQSTVAIRDRVVQAYQDIMKMPI